MNAMHREGPQILMTRSFYMLVLVTQFWNCFVWAFQTIHVCPTNICRHFGSSMQFPATTNEKKIVFLRHSITYMNEYLGESLSFGAPGFTDVFAEKEKATKYQDTPLSPNGVKLVQKELTNRRPEFVDDDVDLIVVSPLRRALQTYDLGLRPHLEGRNIPVVALPLASERLFLISDVGSPIHKLQKEFPYVIFDEIVDREKPWWWTPAGSGGSYTEWRPVGRGQRYACPGEPIHAFTARMENFKKWLDDRPEQKIVVVCHHGVIEWLIDMDFDNCQWRQVPCRSISPAGVIDGG